MRFLSRNALPIGKNSLKAKKGRALPVPRKRNQPPSRRDFIHRQRHGAVHEISAFPDNLQFGRRTLDLYRYRKCNRCSIGRRMKGMLNDPSRYDRPVLLQFENDVQGEIRPRCRSKVPMKRRRVDARLGKRKRAVPRRVRDRRTGRDTVDVKEQRVPRRSGRGRRGIGRKQLRIGRRPRRPRCARRTRGTGRASSARCPRNACRTRGASRARCARNARCACHSHARGSRGTSDARGTSRASKPRGTRYTRRTSCARRARCPYGSCSTRGASRARCARNARCACHSHARCTSGTSNTRGSRHTRRASRASKPRGTRYTRRTSCARCSSGAGRSRDTGAAGASGQAVRFRKHFIALLIAGTREAPADADSVVSCHFFLPCTDTYARQSEAAPDCPYGIVCRKRKKRDASAWRENHSVAEIDETLQRTKHYIGRSPAKGKSYKKNSADILPRRFFKIPYSRHKIISRSCASRRRRGPSRTESP